MAGDNVQLPGTSAVAAADNVDGVLYQRVKPSFGLPGQATDVSSSHPLPVEVSGGTVNIGGALPPGTNNIGNTRRRLVHAACTAFVRPANTTAYSANDIVADNAVAASVNAMLFNVSDTNDASVAIERMRVFSTDTGLSGINFRGWLFNVDPKASSSVLSGDNAAFNVKQLGFVGRFKGAFIVMNDGAVAELLPEAGGQRIICGPVTGGTSLWALLQVLDNGWTPSANSTQFSAKLDGEQGAA